MWVTVLLFCLVSVSQQHFPDVQNITEVLGLAELAANAYHSSLLQNTIGPFAWRNSTLEWMYVKSFGWNSTGRLRGHIYKHNEKSIVTIAFKGTSPGSKEDASEDNCIFGCCCSVASCSNNTCDLDLFLSDYVPKSYYTLALESYRSAKEEYPDSQIWFTGHSLGGMLAVTAGLAMCQPAVGFASPGDRLFAERTNISLACSDLVHHIGYYRDPIFTGTCGWLCRLAGFYIDAKCHLGKSCMFTDPKLNSADVYKHVVQDIAIDGPFSIRYHTINWFIDNVLSISETSPECFTESECVDSC